MYGPPDWLWNSSPSTLFGHNSHSIRQLEQLVGHLTKLITCSTKFSRSFKRKSIVGLPHMDRIIFVVGYSYES